MTYNQSPMDYVDMLARTGISLQWNINTHYIFWSLYPRMYMEGFGDVTLWEYWMLIVEEVEWVKKMRYE